VGSLLIMHVGDAAASVQLPGIFIFGMRVDGNRAANPMNVVRAGRTGVGRIHLPHRAAVGHLWVAGLQDAAHFHLPGVAGDAAQASCIPSACDRRQSLLRSQHWRQRAASGCAAWIGSR